MRRTVSWEYFTIRTAPFERIDYDGVNESFDRQIKLIYKSKLFISLMEKLQYMEIHNIFPMFCSKSVVL